MAQRKKAVEFHKQTQPAPRAVRKIETDEILTGLDKFEYLLGMYWKPIAAGVAAVILIIVALVIIQAARKAGDAATRSAFADAATIEELSKVIQENPGHPAGVNARFKLASLYADKKEFQKAHDTLREIADQSKNAPFLRVQAALHAAYMLEAAGKDNDAINEFNAVIEDSFASEDQRQEAFYSAARLCVKLGKTAQAERLLAAVNYSRKDSLWVMKASALKLDMARPAAKPAPATKPEAKAEAKPAAPEAKAEAKPAAPAPEAKPAAPAPAPAAK